MVCKCKLLMNLPSQVIAVDSLDVIGSGTFESRTTINIDLINVNDEYPQFVNAPYNVTIKEHSSVNSSVVMVIYVIKLLI